MSKHQPSDDTVIVAMARDFQVTHSLTDSGDDIIGIYVDDEQIGDFCLALTVEQAQKVATRLTALLCTLPQVRAAKERKNKEN